MAHYTYQDYMELKTLFLSYFKPNKDKEMIVLSQEVIRFLGSEIKRAQREVQAFTRGASPLSLDQMEELGYAPADPLNVEELIEAEELSNALHEAISWLSERDQQIVVLYAMGYTEREIASVVGGCQKSINNWKKAAFAKLRASLEKYR